MEYPSLGGVVCAIKAATFIAAGLLINRSMLIAIFLYGSFDQQPKLMISNFATNP